MAVPLVEFAEGFDIAEVHVVPSVERSTTYPVWVTSVGAVHERLAEPLPATPDNTTVDVRIGVPVVVENPDANDTNFNKSELERLEKLQAPLEKSSEHLLQESKFFEDIKQPKAVEPSEIGKDHPTTDGTKTDQ